MNNTGDLPPGLPKITVITPSLNQGDYINETITSVIDQGYPNLEYIIIDGGSTDQTLEILDRYSDRVYWISERDRGQSHAINKGLGMANGEVIAYLNSDDIYLPGTLHKVGRFFASHSDAAWLTGRCRFIDGNGIEIRGGISSYKNFWLFINSYQVLKVLDYISQPASFWRREVFDEFGGFDEDLQYAMDYDFSLRVGEKFKLWVLHDYLAAYRIHPSSKAGSSVAAQFEADFQIAQRYSSSKFLTQLHKLHNALIINIYRMLLIQAPFQPLITTGSR